MMNSMNKKEGTQVLVDQLKDRFDLKASWVQAHEVAIDLAVEDLHRSLAFMKEHGFKQLSHLTCVDWLEENKFQLIVNLFDWTKGIRFILRSKMDRSKPRLETITAIYPGAKYYERELHEFFGIDIIGNPSAEKQLFLEGWDDLPPLRKDFIARDYSDKKYVKRHYEKSFGQPGGEPFERD